ncbi:MAG: endonuclease VII domain-containing protein [Planctomycetes bacterium]|nr:endonuclease VII domain-containing protein [Planctomycetota bacterium]
MCRFLTPQIFTCPVCSQDFEAKSSRRKFCGRKCFGIDQKNKNPLVRFERRLREKYNLSYIRYAEMLEQQNNRCKICKEEFYSTEKMQPVVDHDHSSNLVRGILCTCCNTGLGMFNESEEAMREAIEYIRYSKSLT